MGIGLIRVVLALTVVITHTHPFFGFTLGNPTIAVRSFFIISGFYMSLVLNEKYSSFYPYIKSRFLRIYPIYWTVLVLTILASLTAYTLKKDWVDLAYYAHYWPMIKPGFLITTIVTNIALLGRSIVMFSGFNPTTGWLTFNIASNYSTFAWPFLLVPQAWTLELEILFYLLAPLIVRQKLSRLILIFSAAIAFRLLMLKSGFSSDYWSYRFFFSEICFFILGAFAYKIYRKLPKDNQMISKFGWIGTIIIIAQLSAFGYIETNFATKEWFFYLTVVLLLPIVFLYSKNNYFDRKIGELSYPIYISHILVITTIIGFFKQYVGDYNFLAPISFILTTLFSLCLITFVQNPIDKIKQNKNKQTPKRQKTKLLAKPTELL